MVNAFPDRAERRGALVKSVGEAVNVLFGAHQPPVVRLCAAYATADACVATMLSVFTMVLKRDGGGGLLTFHRRRLSARASGVAVATE
jgi:hypothetical protein